jgi:glucose-6-phosphate dehydrogenase assembly protein OpcA
MSDDVWSEQDTTPDAIDEALRRLLRERYAANPGLAPARVLNLIVVVDREWKGEIANRLERVGRYHASRTVLCAVEEGRQTLDAVAVMSYEEPKNDGLAAMREHVEIDMGPEHLGRLDAIVDPVLVSELPTVLWIPHGHDGAIKALRGKFDVMLLDSDTEGDSGLARASDLIGSAYVVDLAWLRTTPWRERLAASFDLPERRPFLERLQTISVRHRPTSASSAALLAGWLSSRLAWEPRPFASMNGSGIRRAEARTGRGEQVEVVLEPFDLEVPGLAGVTVTCDGGFSLSLDRAPGGLCARSRTPEAGEKVWQILGASRGEGGILGEGVRQALLRDPTYGPALAAARSFCG